MRTPNAIHIITFLLLALFCAPELHAQKRGIKLIEQGRVADGAAYFERYVNRNPEDGKAHEHLAGALRKLNRYRDSEVHYRRATDLGDVEPESHMHYAQILMKNGKSEEAAGQVRKYLSYEPESFAAKLVLASIENMDAWKMLPNSFEVFALDGINGPSADFSPLVYKNGLVFITERSTDFVNENGSEFNNQPFLSAYYAEYGDEEFKQLSDIGAFMQNLNGDHHVGPVTIDTARNEIIYSQVAPTLRKKETVHLKTYQARIHNGKRLKGKKELYINSKDYSVTHPALSPDGNTLFFASDMPGGSGGLDLYFMKRDTSGGGWKDPVRLPDAINTKLNESFPYVQDENTLFFSSDGLSGYGGLDLFMVRKKNGRWQKPINLKEPINSSADDFGIVYKNASIGYFSSDRSGGMGKDDIYRFVQIADPEDTERVNVNGVFEYADLPKDGVQLALLDEFDNVLLVTTTDSLGQFDFGQLPPNSTFKIEVQNMSSDSLVRSRMYLVNADGDKVIDLDRLNESAFAFSTLPKESIAALPIIVEQEPDVGKYSLFGQVYKELPRMLEPGVTLLVFDDNGTLVASTVTDSAGYYQIDNLSKSNHYVVQLDSGNEDLFASVFFDDGGEIRNIDYTSGSLFQFKHRPVPVESPTVVNSVPATGYFSLNGQGVSGARLAIMDSSRSNMRPVRTGRKGYFDFGRVHPNENYTILIPDSMAALTFRPAVLMLDYNGNGVLYAQRITANSFRFKSLAIDGKPTDLRGSYSLTGQVYEKLPGDYQERTQIAAYDADGNLIEIVMTDANGQFEFSKLSPDENYIFKMKEEDTSRLKVSLDGKETGKFSDLSAFVYEKLQQQYLQDLERVRANDQLGATEVVAGQVYQKLPGDYGGGIKVYAVDAEGNVIDSTYTDASGSFEFKSLEREEDFTIRLSDVEDTELSIAFFDSKGFYDESVKLDSNNTYKYDKVIMEAVSDLEGLPLLFPFVYGQVYKKLPGDYTDGKRLIALDENGNIVDIATLDAYGRFEFHKLDPDGTYTLQLEDEKDTDLNLSLTNANYASIQSLAGDEAGNNVQFSLNNKNYQQSLTDAVAILKPEDDARIEVRRPKIQAPVRNRPDLQIYYPKATWTLNETDSSNLLGIAKKLEVGEDRLLSIESHASQDEALMNRTFSAQRSVSVARLLYEQGIALDRLLVTNWEDLKPAEDCPPGIDCDSITLAKNRRTDVTLKAPSQVPAQADHLIYYEFSEWKIPPGSFGMLNRLADTLKADPTLRVSIDTYTDFWGKYDMNLRISELRAINLRNYLASRGVDQTRISAIWHGEGAPVGESKIIYPIVIDQRKLNRRAEIRLYKREKDDA